MVSGGIKLLTTDKCSTVKFTTFEKVATIGASCKNQGEQGKDEVTSGISVSA